MIDPKKIWSSSQLPTLPSVAMKLLELARDPETEFKDVIDVVKTDPAITTKILKAANSSFFGFKSPVTSIERAVPLLGTTVVTTLALSFSLVDAAMTSGPLAQHYTAYWKQSIVQAVAAEVLAERVRERTGERLFFDRAALGPGPSRHAQDGVRTTTCRCSSNGKRKAARSRSSKRPVWESITSAWVLNSMREWKLPQQLIAAVTLHHATIAKLLEDLKDPTLVVDRVVAIAATVGDYFCSTAKGAALERLESLAFEFFQMDQAALQEYLDRTRERIDRAGSLFCVSFEGLGTSADLMAEASEQFARVAVREHMASTQMEIQRQAAEKANQELESKNQELAGTCHARRADRTLQSHVLCRVPQRRNQFRQPHRRPDRRRLLRHRSFQATQRHVRPSFRRRGAAPVARIYSEVLRKSDVVARYGGEEFVVLVHQPTEKGLEKLSERLRRAIEAARVLV